MAISAEQLEKRRKYIGASEVAAVMNLDKFKNAYDLWLIKTGRVNLEQSEESKPIKRGRYLEPALLMFAEEELGALEKNAADLEYIKGDIIDHPDAIVKATGNPVEAKSVGESSGEFWGEEGSSVVPDRVILQAQIHLYCTGKPVCHIPADLPWRDFELFQMTVDKEILQAILDAVGTFMSVNIKKDIPPAKIAPTLDIIKRVSREANSIVKLDDEKVEEFLKIKEAFKALEDRKDELQSQMLASLYDEQSQSFAEAGQWSGGQITYYAQKRSGFDTKRLQDEQPEIAAKYMKETEYRVLRFAKPKKAK